MRIPTILATVCLLLVSCQQEEGCTDASAYNFNPTAEIDDGTCWYSGCTDQLAVNYDETATVDDGSCVFLEDLQPSIDGYTYGVVQIGDQVWFSENLRTTVYANGDSIPSSLADEEWGSMGWGSIAAEGATAVYGEGSGFCVESSPDIDACDEVQSLAAYGRLYNWYAVDDARGLCPAGWHVPADDEWTELKDYIASQGFAGTEGMALKSTSGWSNNGNGTDDFGFSALPGGFRSGIPLDFNGGGSQGYWWSSSPSVDPFRLYLVHSDPGIDWNPTLPGFGFSVRCLRDAE